MGLGIWRRSLTTSEVKRPWERGIMFGGGPDGWHHLSAVFTNLGNAWHGGPESGWSNNIWERAEILTPGLEADHRRAIKLRFEHCIRLLKMLRSGELESGYQLKGGGLVTPMDREMWIVSNHYWRFEDCAINPEMPFEETAPQTHWLYVSEASLMPVLSRWRKGDRSLIGSSAAIPSRVAKTTSANSRGGNWVGQRATSQQQRVCDFFAIAEQYMAGGANAVADTALREKYVNWNRDRKPLLAPYRRTGFEEMLDRYLDGFRINDKGRWVAASNAAGLPPGTN